MDKSIEKRIEEVAIDVGNNCVNFYGNEVDYCCIEDGLRQIATEQEQITKKEMIDKACKWIEKHFPGNGYVNAQKEFHYYNVDIFRRAMED